MAEYNLFDKITDFFATSGALWLISEIWREAEVWQYGTSQESAVDGVFAMAVSIAVVVILRVCSLIKHEED